MRVGAGGRLTVVAVADALPDPGAARDVLDRALAARGLTGALLLVGSAAELAAAVASDGGPEPVLVPGPGTDVDDLALPGRVGVLRVDLDDRPRDPSPPVRRHLRGRGLDGIRYAVDAWSFHRSHPPTTYRYGPDRDQHADLRLPGQGAGQTGHPVAVLVHGGYWRSRWESDLMEPMAADLTDRGWATWNVEYRRPDDHGWAATTADVAAAVAALGGVDAPLDLTRVALLGHSAGGQLAVHLAADLAADPTADVGADHLVDQATDRSADRTGDRDGRTAGDAGARGTAARARHVRPALAVALAGVLDLADADRRRLGDGAVARALGGSTAELPDVARASSPVERVPVGIPLAVVCGHDDELLSQSRSFAGAARAAGDDVVLTTGEGDHFAVIDPRSALWPAVIGALGTLGPVAPRTGSDHS